MRERELIAHLKRLRLKKNLKQSEVAGKVGLSAWAYQRLENGTASLKVDQLLNILQVLDPGYLNYFLEFFRPEATRHHSGILDDGQIDQCFSKIMGCFSPRLYQNETELNVIKSSFKIHGESSEVGYWEWNLSKREIFWSQELLQIFHLDQGTHLSFNDFTLLRIHPHDRDQFKQAFKDFLLKNIVLSFRYRVIGHPQGVFEASTQGRIFTLNDQLILFGVVSKSL
jgi:transcriptional regulator with XRE-family HTH domain